MFELHPRLAADTLPVLDWPLCRVLLMNDATYPWLILVPRIPGVVEIHDLPEPAAAGLMEEAVRASKALKILVGATKMNLAALGNIVPQLHLHLIARFETDPAWPGPVWGRAPARPYGEEALAGRLGALRAVLGSEVTPPSR